MAVYERSYKRYAGALAPQWTRLFVLPRYTLGEVFRSKLFLVFFVISLLWPLSQAARIYFYHNAGSLFEAIPDLAEAFSQFFAIDAEFFWWVMYPQSMFAFVAALFIGPGLVSRDLANNGLPLYLSRPISRAEYVLGKFAVLGILLSLVTWVPGLFLYSLQSGYAGWGWALKNTRLAAGIFVGSWAWILTIGFLALALSAWVKWRPVAGFMMVMVFLGGAFLGSVVINPLFRTDWGDALNLGVVIAQIWGGLLGLDRPSDLPFWAAWLSLLAFIGACVYLLHRKIRAYEVVS